MIFEQEGTVPLPLARLWDFMVDPVAVSACMPGLEAFAETAPDRYEGTVRVKVGPISLRLQGRLAVTARDREARTMAMSAAGREARMASGVDATITVNLVALDAAATQLRVHTEAKVLGKLGEFGQPIMRKSADRILKQFVDAMIAKIGAAPAARRHAAVEGGTVSCLEQGEGPALVLLHGVGSAAQSWKEQLAGLSDRARVIAWDAPGYGELTALAEPAPAAAAYADRLHALLRVLGVARCHLVGHSLGTLIAARFAADHPEMIASLTLAAASTGHARLAADERERLMRARLDDIAALGPRGMAEKRGPRLVTPEAPEAVRRAVIETMAAVRPEGYAQAVRMLSQGDILADIARLPAGMRVQFVFGSADVVTPPEQNRRIAAHRPAAPVTEIPAAGHALYLEQPAAFNAALRAFIAG